jgi:uncharacterized protein (TIGR02453 family)
MNRYFSPRSFRFLRALARHNERAWFHEHKADYEAHLREPFLRLIADLQVPLSDISPHYVADPRKAGGSLFRIHRDVRFSNNKAPYKTWSGARCHHERARQVHAPSFYIHIEPGHCFLGGGLWHPETTTQRRIRDFIVDNPDAWQRATRDPAFLERFHWGGSSLVRSPRGYPSDHPLIDDLKRKDFVVAQTLDDAVVTGPALLEVVVEGFRAAAPLVDYLCASLDLEF